jgi:ATP-binding cassette subfamily C protein
METTAWTQLHSVMNAQEERRPFALATLRRIGRFARPHRRRIALFVLLGVGTALLAVATPVLAGRVVDVIVSDGDGSTVVRLALLIALIAVAEAALGILGRRLSATLGEHLILDLRTAVFDHVQRMPVAFFTRTRTGALVSRLNNDVIGAQRAFSNTLSGVVGNLVTLLLTLVTEEGPGILSWLIDGARRYLAGDRDLTGPERVRIATTTSQIVVP